MKKFSIILIIILMFLMQGCIDTSVNQADIVPPNNSKLDIYGTWKITEVLRNQASGAKVFENDIIQFHEDYIYIGKKTFTAPKYKYKKVIYGDYIFAKDEIELMGFKPSEKYADIITITSNEQYVGDIVVLDENTAVGDISSIPIKLEKISNKTDKHAQVELDNDKNTDKSQNKELPVEVNPKSAVLLGLRSSYINDSGEEDYYYRTIWIGANNKKVDDVYTIDCIFFPRHSGFWTIESNRVRQNGVVEDIITAKDDASLKTEDEAKEIEDEWSDKSGKLFKKILFISNDYISVEVNGEGYYNKENFKWKESELKMYPVDSLNGSKSVSMTDLLGNVATQTMKDDYNFKVKSLNINPQNVSVFNENSYGMDRKAGHWFFKGRLHVDRDGKMENEDYNMKIIPGNKVVKYDDLCVQWKDVKDKIPDAEDVYTSPNKDIAIILTDKNILVYGITNNSLDDEAIRKIELFGDQKAIMAEWATGKYVDIWRNEVAEFCKVKE